VVTLARRCDRGCTPFHTGDVIRNSFPGSDIIFVYSRCRHRLMGYPNSFVLANDYKINRTVFTNERNKYVRTIQWSSFSNKLSTISFTINRKLGPIRVYLPYDIRMKRITRRKYIRTTTISSPFFFFLTFHKRVRDFGTYFRCWVFFSRQLREFGV